MTILVYTCREFTLGYFRNGLRAGGQRKPGPLVVGELHFARLACAPKSRPQTMRRAPRTARLGKLCLAGIGPLRAPISATNPRARTPWWLGGSLPNLATHGAIFARNRVPARNADHT